MCDKEKKCKICIFYHVPERELDGCLMIADMIKKINPKAKVVVKEFYEGIYFSFIYKPDVVLTIPPRDINSSYRLTILKKLTGCAILSLLTEGFYSTFSERNIQIAVGTNKYSPKLVDKYLFWGEKTRQSFVDILKKNNKITDTARSQTVGYTYYDVDAVKNFFKGKKLPDSFFKWKNAFKKRILVLTGFHIAEETKEEQIIMSAFRYHGIRGKEKEYAQEISEWKIKRKYFLEYRKKYLRCVIRLAERHPDVGILVKLHPVEFEDFVNGKKHQVYCELEQYKNVLLLKENILLSVILPYIDTMVHYGSTSGLEAYIHDIPTVQLYDSKYEQKIGRPGFCIYDSTVKLDVNIPDEFERTLSNKIQTHRLESVEAILKEQFNWSCDEKEQYHPVETYAEIVLDSIGKGQKIDDDGFYLSALISDMGYDIKHYHIKNMVRMFVHGKHKDYIEYQRILKKLDVSFLGCMMVELRIVYDKMKRLIRKA